MRALMAILRMQVRIDRDNYFPEFSNRILVIAYRIPMCYERLPKEMGLKHFSLRMGIRMSS